VNDIAAGVSTAIVVEDYPDAMGRGPSVFLVLQWTVPRRTNSHVVWAIPKGLFGTRACLVTGPYRP